MTEHTTDLPIGLVVTDDGSILNWQGVNYVRQDTTDPVEPATPLAAAVAAYAEDLQTHEGALPSMTWSEIAGDLRVLVRRHAAAPSVEQIEEVLERETYTRPTDERRNIAQMIHALYGTPVDAGDIEAIERDLASFRRHASEQMKRAEKAESAHINALAEVERCKAALEAAEERIETLLRVDAANEDRTEAMHAFEQAEADLVAALAADEKAAQAHSAARAAVEAETSEEA